MKLFKKIVIVVLVVSVVGIVLIFGLFVYV